MIAYGVSANQVDENLRVSESTTFESLKRFVKAVVEKICDEYLRLLNNNNFARLLAEGKKHGFHGMLGSIVVCIEIEELSNRMAWHVF